MSTTPLTRNECYDVRKVQARLATHDDRMDDVEAMAIANEVGDGTITTAKLDDDALSADSDGRGKMEDDFFDAATVLAKFDADSFDNAQLILAVKDGAFNADAATRALFDDGIWNAAKLGTDSVTGPKIAATAFASYVVAAGNGAGARTMTGALVGDKVIAVINLTDSTNDAADAEAVVTVNDQLQQSGTNHTGDKWLVLTVRG